MGHYDELLAKEEGPFESVAMPATMLSLRKLGMRPVSTEDHRWAVFSGHGLQIRIPSDAELSPVECGRLLVENARAAGAEEQRLLIHKALGLR